MRRPTFGGPLTCATWLALLGLCVPICALAQNARAVTAPGPGAVGAAPAPGGNVENDPIRCWARASAGAVRIGEQFRVSLTCAVIETELVQVIPDESKLGVNVVQMTPFEVAGGNHPADLKTGTRRFLQYDYDLRMINPDAIGTDVPIPMMQVSYRINSRIAGNQQTQGRELTYVLPIMWVKVLSTVPQDATDIRDSDGASFDRVEQINFRAGVLEIVGTTLVVLGGVMTLLALISIARRAAKTTKGPQERMLSRPALMRLAVRELHAAQQDGAGGWTDAALNRATSALRIAAAGAINRPISQRYVDAETSSGEGRIIVSRLGRSRPTAVSAAVTSQDIGQVLQRERETSPRRPLLEELQQTLDHLAAAQYSRPGADRSGIDLAVTKAIELARQIRSQQAWPREWLRRVTARASLVHKQA
ncbi:MAG: hypothetical protein AB7N65_06815 [Vicinamibacterales bacterium]